MRTYSALKSAIWRVPAMLLALGLLAMLVNAIGISALGGATRWVSWLQGHRVYFLLWRVLLYSGTVFAWLPMRRRVLSAEADSAAAIRLLRAEVAAIVAVVLIEGMTFFQSP